MMTTAARKTPSSQIRPEDQDDLTRIKGIGEITQQWLRDTFGVYTFHDLANVAPDAIEERLKAEGKITAPAKIKKWVVQAKQLADEAGQPVYQKRRESTGPAEWMTFSTFVFMFEERQVEGASQYQTKAHHMEADTTQTWPGILPAGCTEWMAAQLGPSVAEVSVGGVSVPSSPPEPEPAQFSDGLAQQITKVQSLAGERVTPPVRRSGEASDPPEPTETVTAPQSPYSSKLQQVIAKARTLADGELARRR